MVLKNHLVYDFLTSDDYIWDWIEKQCPHFKSYYSNPNLSHEQALALAQADPKIQTSYHLFNPKGNVLYAVTNTVIKNIDLLKVKKREIEGELQYDWKVFNHIADCKKTFILPPSSENKANGGWQIVLRLVKVGPIIQFLHLGRRKDPEDPKHMYNEHAVVFYVDTLTGKQCDHFSHEDVKRVEDFLYRLLCFIWLGENTEEEIKPGKKYGGKKDADAVLNSFTNIPVTIINSKWNITRVNSEGFDVSGHFRILTKRYENPKCVWIAPYRKKGIVRKAKSEILKSQ